MIEIAGKYMKQMDYGNRQVLIVHHTDRNHLHIHLIMNRIDKALKYCYMKMKGEAERIS